MILYIVRHGQTKWNVQKRLQGASDTDLNENGIALAKVTGEALKEVPFSCCFTSPLKRARETAELVLGERKNLVPVYPDDRIREISFGVWEGQDSTLLPQEMLDNFFHHPEKISAAPGRGRAVSHPGEDQGFLERHYFPGRTSGRDCADRLSRLLYPGIAPQCI